MDCGAGAAIGRQFMGAAMNMGQGMADPMLQGDGLMQGDGVMDEWSEQFSMVPPPEMAMQAQMRQKIAMEQEFLEQQQHMEQMEMEQAFQKAQIQQGQETAQANEAFEEAFHGTGDWAAQFADQLAMEGGEWAQEYNDNEVQIFTVEGEPLITYEEKAKQSNFHNLMEQINQHHVEIDEVNGTLVPGLGPDQWEKELEAEATQANNEAWAQEMIRENADAFEDAWEGQEAQEAEMIEAEWAAGQDGDDFIQDYMEQETGDAWADEYAEIQKKMRAVQESTDYPFEPNNPYLFHDTPWEEGNDLLAFGNLAEAILAFEAVCQQDPERVEAWRLLGASQAENEKDALAIVALNHARMLNPKDRDVLATLAACNINEQYHEPAMRCLREWLLAHPDYEHLGRMNPEEREALEPSGDAFIDEYLSKPSDYDNLVTLFQAAREMNPMDYEVHVNLGSLAFLAHEYDEAVGHFREALKIKGDDPKLWNKLGATLANGNRWEEALVAYNRALDINPGYVRAYYNLGVAYSNSMQHEKAAKQLLRALVMQQGGTQTPDSPPRGNHEIWDILRMTFNLMDRTDLVEITWKRDLSPLLREFGLSELL